MSDDKSSTTQADHDLLARLNALKKTHIDLDDKQYRIPVTASIRENPDLQIDPSPARALHADLVSRFKSLSGTKAVNPIGDQRFGGGDIVERDDVERGDDDEGEEEDGKTIEELLAELGGEGAWNVEKDEATEIDDLLRSANTALRSATAQEESNRDDYTHDLINGNSRTHDLPNVDIQVSAPFSRIKAGDSSEDDGTDADADTENDAPSKSKKDLDAELDREADDIIARLKDELKNADTPTESGSDQGERKDDADDSSLPAAPAFDLPSTPSKDPEPPSATSTSTAESDLASRFASLILPTTAPSSDTKNALPAAPSTKPGTKAAKFGSSARYEGHTADEIDSWCTICLEDATLRCLGCDGDLYCAKCWIEGHRGPDAGYDERKHRALEFRRNDGEGKETKRKYRVAA